MGKLQRSPSPSPTYLKSKRLVVLTFAGLPVPLNSSGRLLMHSGFKMLSPPKQGPGGNVQKETDYSLIRMSGCGGRGVEKIYFRSIKILLLMHCTIFTQVIRCDTSHISTTFQKDFKYHICLIRLRY